MVVVVAIIFAVSINNKASKDKEADKFSNEQGVSTDGVGHTGADDDTDTDKEMEKVYKDISTNTFTYDNEIETVNTVTQEIICGQEHISRKARFSRVTEVTGKCPFFCLLAFHLPFLLSKPIRKEQMFVKKYLLLFR